MSHVTIFKKSCPMSLIIYISPKKGPCCTVDFRRLGHSIMAKGCIVAWLLPLRCSLFVLPDFIHIYAIIIQNVLVKREVLQQEYSQPPILPSPHFWWVVKPNRTMLVSTVPIYTLRLVSMFLTSMVLVKHGRLVHCSIYTFHIINMYSKITRTLIKNTEKKDVS